MTLCRLKKRKHRPQSESEYLESELGWNIRKIKKQTHHLIRQTAPRSSSTGWKLDYWQKQALDCLDKGHHIIVDAPTGSGKTRIVEALIKERLSWQDFRICYTTPVKSLAHDKFREFGVMFGEHKVGLMTGDLKIQTDAPILVATLESYRNLLFQNSIYPIVVLDEYHYFADQRRGTAWEEACILTPPDTQLILMSATVPNGDEFRDWLEEITKRSCRLIQHKQRPVPLSHLIFVDDVLLISHPESWKKDHQQKIKKAFPLKTVGRQKIPFRWGHIGRVIEKLQEEELTPALIYASRRQDVEKLFQKAWSSLPSYLTEEQEQQVLDWLKNYDISDPCLRDGLTRGFAYHHSGLLPKTRVLIEELLKAGLVHVCFATMGLSVGVNFCVRTVLLLDQTRPDEKGSRPYQSSEIKQMLGRAGRRGLDSHGFAVWLGPGHLSVMNPEKQTEVCRPQFRLSEMTFLNLLSRGDYGYLSKFYRSSLTLKKYQKTDDVAILHDDFIHEHLMAVQPFLEKPCDSFVKAEERFSLRQQSPCSDCWLRSSCHPLIRKAKSSRLEKIYRHLVEHGFCHDKGLTAKGVLAKTIKYEGALCIAEQLQSADELDEILIGVSGFSGSSYVPFPHRPKECRDWITSTMILIDRLYPIRVFPDYYVSNEDSDTFLFFHGGLLPIAKAWIQEEWSWKDLCSRFTREGFGEGDLLMFFSRYLSFLMALTQSSRPQVAQRAELFYQKALRDVVRENLIPSSINLSKTNNSLLHDSEMIR